MDYRQFQLAGGVMETAHHPGYQPHIMEPWQLKIPKQEPIDDRDDSGINSGNSSPNSESSRDLMNPYTTPPPSVPQRALTGGFSPSHYVKSYNNEDFVGQRPSFPQAPNNLLSPPMSEPSTGDVKDNEDALQNLQMALKQNSYLAMPGNLTQTPNNKSSSDDGKSDDDSQNKTPKSSGKKKNIKCKHCSLTFVNKEDMWEHYRTHIKQEKLLECPRCAFVTEYKHHFEYHLRNHDGSKPFKCQECSYECVSKSMLNSHMKSHSTVYQYQCANCTYVSKYCHSLKQHLRKYNHKPGTVLSPDGVPNPFSVIDVYGTRRGPKLKKPPTGPPQEMPQMPMMNHFMQQSSPQMPQFPQFPILPQLQEMSQFFNPLLLSNPALLQNLQRIARERQLSSSTEEHNSPSTTPTPEELDNNNRSSPNSPTTIKEEPRDEAEAGVLDLSQPNPYKKRRKGPAYKLSTERMDTTDDEDEHLTTMFSNVEVVQQPQQQQPPQQPAEQEEDEQATTSTTKCQYCNIDFHDEILHNMHMGYHGFKDPFTCNLCGESYPDKVRFFLHIGQKKH